jgi:hypothetical protein
VALPKGEKLTMTTEAHTELYVTPALPDHYVAKVPGGGNWLLPAALLFGTPEALWAAARPYRGNYDLWRVVPAAFPELYAQPPADWEAPGRLQ